MINKGKIKVVKRTQMAAVSPQVKIAANSRTAAREMVSTVTEWVTDLRQRKTGETRAAIERLFNTAPQPSES